MPSYKLTYFNARARGELPRLLFAAAGQEFEDCRVEMEDWGKLKDKTPQGSMPLLEVDGGPMICQSQAVARYLARKFGLYGKTDEDAVVIDQIMDTALDLFNPFMPILFEAQEEQPKKIEEFYKTKGEKVLQFIENLFQGKNGFAVGETLSVADLYVFACIESVVQPISASLKDDKLLDKYPKLAAMKKTVENLPRIKKYLDARKPTPF